MQNLITGNFDIETQGKKGWVVGDFIPTDSPFHTDKFEMKWARREAGFEQSGMLVNDSVATLTILIEGTFSIFFHELEKTVRLVTPGDYVYYNPQVAHTGKAETDCLFIQLRWVV